MKKMLLATLTFWGLMAHSGSCQTIDTLLDVGGYRLFFHIIQGKGMPILFEGGAGADVTVWDNAGSPFLRGLLRNALCGETP
jgi:hypothetical protein